VHAACTAFLLPDYASKKILSGYENKKAVASANQTVPFAEDSVEATDAEFVVDHVMHGLKQHADKMTPYTMLSVAKSLQLVSNQTVHKEKLMKTVKGNPEVCEVEQRSLVYDQRFNSS